jgi:hypothetical protein
MIRKNTRNSQDLNNHRVWWILTNWYDCCNQYSSELLEFLEASNQEIIQPSIIRLIHREKGVMH